MGLEPQMDYRVLTLPGNCIPLAAAHATGDFATAVRFCTENPVGASARLLRLSTGPDPKGCVGAYIGCRDVDM